MYKNRCGNRNIIKGLRFFNKIKANCFLSSLPKKPLCTKMREVESDGPTENKLLISLTRRHAKAFNANSEINGKFKNMSLHQILAL